MFMTASSYLVGVVEVHDAAPAGGDVLMALALSAHDQSGVHVHVVAGKVQADQALEDHRVGGFGGREEDEQARGGAAVGDHVQDGAETGRLLEFARGKAIESVEKAADGVEEAAAARVKGHEVQGAEGQDDAEVALEYKSVRCWRAFSRMCSYRLD